MYITYPSLSVILKPTLKNISIDNSSLFLPYSLENHIPYEYLIYRNGGENKMASFEIGARSLFNFRNERFFLLVEDEITIPDKGVEIDPVNIYEIDQQTFNFIREEGDTPVVVPVFKLPPVPPGFELERKCIFSVNNSYFVIYDLENGTDNHVLLRISAALFNSLRNSGVRECIPQNFI